MANKDGRCPNCGSLLSLDASAEKGHCLFCDAVFDNKTAFAINENPDGYEFPNEPQPKYEGPSLNSRPNSTTKQPVQSTFTEETQKKKSRPAPQRAYVHKEPIKLPEIKLPPKIRIKVIIVSIVLALLIAGISTPLIITRNNMRAQLMDSMTEYTPFSVDPERDAVIRRIGNTYLMVVADEAVSEDEMIELFKGFAEKRAELRGLEMDDFSRVYRSVTVKLISPDGGYLLAEPRDAAELDSGAALVAIR